MTKRTSTRSAREVPANAPELDGLTMPVPGMSKVQLASIIKSATRRTARQAWIIGTASNIACDEQTWEDTPFFQWVEEATCHTLSYSTVQRYQQIARSKKLEEIKDDDTIVSLLVDAKYAKEIQQQIANEQRRAQGLPEIPTSSQKAHEKREERSRKATEKKLGEKLNGFTAKALDLQNKAKPKPTAKPAPTQAEMRKARKKFFVKVETAVKAGLDFNDPTVLEALLLALADCVLCGLDQLMEVVSDMAVKGSV